MPCYQPFRDDSAQLLLFKIASCLEASGGGAGVTSFNGLTGAVTGVISFNGRDGVVILTLADVAAVADGRYVLKAGDTMTGALVHPDGTAALPSITFTGDLDTGIYRIGSNAIGIATSGVSRWQVNGSGHLLASTDGIFDIGASGANRVGRIFALQSIFVESATYGLVLGISGARMLISGPSNGVILVTDNAGTSFGRWMFGGSTSAFPAIKRQGAGIDFRLADDSAYALITTAGITMSAGSRLSITSGANTRAGNAVLVGGTVTVANTTVTANTIVLLTRKTSGGTIGTSITYTVIAATSFTITSDNILDTSTFSYFLIENP